MFKIKDYIILFLILGLFSSITFNKVQNDLHEEILQQKEEEYNSLEKIRQNDLNSLEKNRQNDLNEITHKMSYVIESNNELHWQLIRYRTIIDCLERNNKALQDE